MLPGAAPPVPVEVVVEALELASVVGEVVDVVLVSVVDVLVEPPLPPSSSSPQATSAVVASVAATRRRLGCVRSAMRVAPSVKGGRARLCPSRDHRLSRT